MADTMEMASQMISPSFGVHQKRKVLYHCDNCNEDVEEVTILDENENEICKFISHCTCEEEKIRIEEEANICIEMQRKSKKALIDNCGIDDIEEVLSCIIKTYKGNIKAYEYLDKFVMDFDRRRLGVILYGQAGSGKTLLAKRTMLRVLKRETNNAVCIFLSVQKLYDQILDAYSNHNSIEPYIKYLENVDLLVLDDLGCEKDNSDAVEKIFRIINARGNMKPTIITTNLNEDSIRKRYGERILSRFYGYYDIILVNGVDFRKEQFKKRQKDYGQ